MCKLYLQPLLYTTHHWELLEANLSSRTEELQEHSSMLPKAQGKEPRY
jgi:hypothetical protein